MLEKWVKIGTFLKRIVVDFTGWPFGWRNFIFRIVTLSSIEHGMICRHCLDIQNQVSISCFLVWTFPCFDFSVAGVENGPHLLDLFCLDNFVSSISYQMSHELYGTVSVKRDKIDMLCTCCDVFVHKQNNNKPMKVKASFESMIAWG